MGKNDFQMIMIVFRIVSTHIAHRLHEPRGPFGVGDGTLLDYFSLISTQKHWPPYIFQTAENQTDLQLCGGRKKARFERNHL
jgi:hypothetical protein